MGNHDDEQRNGAGTGTDARHPIVRFAVSLDAAIDKVSGFAPTFMTTAQKRTALVALEREEQRLHALKLRVMACAGDVAEEAAAKDVSAWLATEARLARHHTARDLKLGTALDQRWTALGDAVADGAVNTDQAVVIVEALDKLPDDLEPEQVRKVEEHLIAEAAHHGPAALAKLGEHFLEVIAPEQYDELLGEQLEREEKRARERTALRVKPVGDGLCRVTATLSETAANRLLTTLDAYTSPRHRQGDVDSPAEDALIPIAKQRGQAFCTLLEHLDPKTLPAHGGDATSLVITMSLEQLRKELGAGEVIGHDTHRIQNAPAEPLRGRDDRYLHERLPNGDVRFARRT